MIGYDNAQVDKCLKAVPLILAVYEDYMVQNGHCPFNKTL